MTTRDDLVSRLRSWVFICEATGNAGSSTCELPREAAAALEAKDAENVTLRRMLENQAHRLSDLERQLAAETERGVGDADRLRAGRAE